MPPIHMCISTLVPEGVLCTVGMSMFKLCLWPSPNLHHATPCKFMKSLHMHTGLAATLPWLVHHSVPTIHLLINFLVIFLHPGTATHVLNPVTLPHLDTVPHLVTHSLE